MGIRELSPELAKKAKDELFENTERIPQDLQTIKDWLAKQPHIKARTDDQWLVSFLRGSKSSLEKTKEKLDLFYTMKTMAPEMTVPLDPRNEVVQYILKAGVSLPLPKTGAPDDPRIMLMRPGLIDPSKAPLLNFINVGVMSSYIQMLEDDQSVVAGQIIIVDMTNVGMSFFTQMTPSTMKKMVVSRQDAFPLRQKGGHHINAPPAFLKIYNVFSVFMNEKMKSRMHIHSDMEALYKLVPKSILPAEYGGDGGPVQDIIDEWVDKFEKHRNWFLEDAKYKTDESKRPGAPKTAETLFGIEGSFRKLDFD